MKKINFLICCIAFLSSLYLGVGGMGKAQYKLEYDDLLAKKPAAGDTIRIFADGVNYKNILERKRFQKSEDAESFDRLFIGPKNVPDLIALIITACTFSMAGAITNYLYNVYKGDKPMSFANTGMTTILGFSAGLFVIALTYLIPTALVKSEDAQVRPFSLMFASLFAGFCFINFYALIYKWFDRISESSKPSK